MNVTIIHFPITSPQMTYRISDLLFNYTGRVISEATKVLNRRVDFSINDVAGNLVWSRTKYSDVDIVDRPITNAWTTNDSIRLNTYSLFAPTCTCGEQARGICCHGVHIYSCKFTLRTTVCVLVNVCFRIFMKLHYSC